MKVSVIIPAYNEENAIGKVIDEIIKNSIVLLENKENINWWNKKSNEEQKNIQRFRNNCC